MERSERSDRAGPVEERAVRLEVNGRALESWTASPGHADALAAGRLLVEGFIRGRADLLGLDVEERPEGTVVRVRVPEDVAAAAWSAHGSRAAASGAPPGETLAQPRPDRPRAPLPPLAAFGPLFRALFAAAELYDRTGGLHTAALCDGTRLVRQVEEVGRHNAVDKAIGLGVLAGDDLSRLGLILSARVSGEMAYKAARAGLAWIASRSVPTTMAVAIAETAGLPIVARAAGPHPHVYAAGSGANPTSAATADSETARRRDGEWGEGKG